MPRSPRLDRRFIMIGFALLVMGQLGLRAQRSRATPWEFADFEGRARMALTVDDINRPSDETAQPSMEVYATAIYGTQASEFSRGLMIRGTFPIPSTGDAAVFRLDLDRRQHQTQWDPERSARLKTHYYVTDSQTDGLIIDAEAVSGSLTLEQLVFGQGLAAFRIVGWLEFVDPGSDGIFDTDDDRSTEIGVTIETSPGPQELAGATAPPGTLPPISICATEYCYTDPGYDDLYYEDGYYDPSCGDAGVGYSTYDDGGCEGDTYDDGGDDLFEPTVGSSAGSDSGGSCDSSDTGSSESGGCDGGGSDYDSGGGGCDSGSSSSSSSGCDSGSGSSSGCGGCEGDVFSEVPDADREESPLEGGLGWPPIILLFFIVQLAHRRDD